MKQFLLILCLCVAASASADPSLVLVRHDDLKALEGDVVLLRDHGSTAFVAADSTALVGYRYILLDHPYAPNQYLLVRGPSQAADMHLPILFQDNAGALVKLPAGLDQSAREFGDAELLHPSSPVERPSRPPTGLDDPILDQWLTNLAADVNADSLFGFVSTLAGWNRYARWTTNDTAAEWVLNKFQSYGLDSAYYHLFTASGSGWTRTARNIIGVKLGTVYPDSIVLIGGHMDATSQSPSSGAPGADDNGTGTAGVIEAARLLSPYEFTHTLMFVGFNAEEQGLQGSDVLASLMAATGRDIVAVVNMDMIGYYDPAGADLWIEGFYTGTSSVWLMNAVRDNCLQFTDLIPYLYPSNGFGSDHVSFHDAGYPAILSIENEYDSYPCYHNTCDLPNQVTATFLRKMALVNIVTAAELALPLGTGSISGTATLEGTQDYSNVTVQVIGGTPTAQTVASGLYQIQSLLAGSYSLAFSRPGWISDTLLNIAVAENQQVTGQNIFLNAAAPGSIAGTVTVSGGGSVTEAIVSAGSAVANVTANGTFVLTPVYAGQYAVTAALDGYSLSSAVVTVADGQNVTGVNLTLYPFWDLESSNFNFNDNGSGWGWGTDAIAGYHSATRVWGTALDANYSSCGNYRLDSPPFSLTHLDSAKLTFWHWYDIEPSGPTVDYDGANVKIAPFGTDNWQVIEPVGGYPQGAGYVCNPIQGEPAYNGTSGSWLPATFDLTPFIGQTVKLRFHLGSDQGVTRHGWYLDDFALLGWHTFEAVPPDAVTNLTVHPAENDLVLRWSPASGAAGYKIYRSEIVDLPFENWTLLATQTATVYADNGAGGLPKAFYLVIATN